VSGKKVVYQLYRGEGLMSGNTSRRNLDERRFFKGVVRRRAAV